MDIRDIIAGLQTRLETISGLKVYGADDLPGSISQYPCAIILPGEVRYHETFTEATGGKLRVIIIFSPQVIASAVTELLEYVDTSGTKSVLAALNGDNTLGGKVDYAVLDRNLGLGAFSWGGGDYPSTEFEVSYAK